MRRIAPEARASQIVSVMHGRDLEHALASGCPVLSKTTISAWREGLQIVAALDEDALHCEAPPIPPKKLERHCR